jgi:hypothetical protein
MKTNFNFVIIILFLIFNSLNADDDMVAITVKARGQVKLTQANQVRSTPIKNGQILKDQDKIDTGPSSTCAVKFLDDKSLLRIRENSSCVIETKKEKNVVDKNILVKIGTFFADLFKPKGIFQVTTPTSVASVKGTRWWIIHSLDGRTIHICIEGLIDISNDAGRVLLRAGQTAEVNSRFELPRIHLTTEDEIPAGEEDRAGIKVLEIGFSGPNEQVKMLKVDIKDLVNE